MADKVPVTVFVDPSVESTITIKPFAGALAKKFQPMSGGGIHPDGWSGTGTGTGIGTPNPDADADVDYNG
jgi:hypothetical protein